MSEKFINKKDDDDHGKRKENDYLRYLTYEGAKERYTEITDNIKERIEFELKVMKIQVTGYF